LDAVTAKVERKHHERDDHMAIDAQCRQLRDPPDRCRSRDLATSHDLPAVGLVTSVQSNLHKLVILLIVIPPPCRRDGKLFYSDEQWPANYMGNHWLPNAARLLLCNAMVLCLQERQVLFPSFVIAEFAALYVYHVDGPWG